MARKKQQKPPAFQFYPNEFLTSQKVLMMRPQAVAGYVFLLCHAWMSDPPCSLPTHEGSLATLSRLGGDWNLFRDEILNCFVTKDGRLYNERLVRAYIERRKYIQHQSESGKLGMQRRYADRYNAVNSAVSKLSNSSSSSSSSSSLKTNTYAHPPEGFAEFWSNYPRKTAKATAQKAWLRLKPNSALAAEILAALEIHKKKPEWNKDDGQYIPHAATWINQRRWEDEIEAKKDEVIF